jgi:uncharacterized membrane protein
MVIGWGVFNLVEGILDHHILNLHHVVERLGVSVYDYAFLASGFVFIVLGLSLVHAGRNDSANRMPECGSSAISVLKSAP